MGGPGIVIFGDPGEITNYLQLQTLGIDFDDEELQHNLRREIRDLVLDFVKRNCKGEDEEALNLKMNQKLRVKMKHELKTSSD